MGMRSFKPTTASRRGMILSDFAEVTRCEPEPSLVRGLRKSGGRNNSGHICVRYITGGHKQRYRIIDFRRDKINVPAKVATIEYDPNRTSRIALLHYLDGEKRYILAPDQLAVGMTVVSGESADIAVGNALPMELIPLGTVVHNIELKRGKGGQLVRSAGTGAQLIAKEGKYVTLRMPSGEMRKVFKACYATIGQVGNLTHENINSGKAGRTRWLGRGPNVRGIAMNPVDHPLGGGEGRSKGGRHPCSPWGWKTKGPKTRKNRRTSYLIVKRRTKNR